MDYKGLSCQEEREDICLDMVSIIKLCSTICKYSIIKTVNSFPKFDDYGKRITYFFPITCIPQTTAVANTSPDPRNVSRPKHIMTGGRDMLKRIEKGS